MRQLRGHREIFRRFQENNEAHRRRRDEIRQLGGLEPLEEYDDWIPPRVVDTGRHRPLGLGLRLYQRTEEEEREMREHLELMMRQMYAAVEAPRGTISYIGNATASLNPCSEIMMDEEWNPFKQPHPTNEQSLHRLNKDWNNDGEFLEKSKNTYMYNPMPW